MKAAVTILLILTLTITSQAVSQSFATHSYSISEGLPSTETYEVFQDSKGFLWFGTDNGVCRFDGKIMEVFNVKDGLSDPVVFGITEDTQGRIWFRTYSGKLSYFYKEKFYTYRFNDILSKICEARIIFSMHYDSLDQLWFGAGEISGKIDRDGNLDTTALATGNISVRLVGETEIISFYGPTASLNKFRINDKSYPFSQPNPLNTYHVACSKQWNNKLYVSVNNAIFEFDGKRLKLAYTGKSPIICMYRDHDNNLWIGYMNKGVERLTDFKSQALSLFEGQSISKVVHDNEGGYWFSTLANGIQYIPSLSVKNFIPITYSRLKAVASSGNRIATGDYSGDVNVYQSTDGRLIWSTSMEDPIISIFRSHQGSLWISTTRETYIYDSLFRLKKTFIGSRTTFLQIEDQKIIGVTGNQIFIYNTTGDLIDRYTGTNSFRSVELIDSLLYFSVRSGFQIRDKQFNLLHDFTELKNLKVSKLVDLNDSLLMVCTIGNGFTLINKKTWEASRFNTGSSFSAHNFYTAVVVDSLLWFGTERGLGVASIKSAVEGFNAIRFLTKKSGLTSDKVNFLAHAKDLLWAFTEEGISLIPLNDTEFENKDPLFFLQDVLVNDQSVLANIKDQRLDLPYDQNNLKLNYRIISFNNPNTATRYRLSPEEPWVYSNNTQLLFPSLAPGEYRFELEYSADGIEWRPVIPVYHINVTLPWWNLLYVQLTALALIIALGYWYFKYQRSIYIQKNRYLKIINDHQQKLIQSEVVTRERERNRISKELHDRVGTNLTAIKLTVSQLLKQHHEPLADDVEEQFQIAIKEIKDIIYDLTPPGLERYGLFTGLKNYIGKLKRSIPINISLKTFGNDAHIYEMNIIVFRVLQELISNSIKHSFAKNITIHINSFDDVLNILYEDDGIGFSYKPELSGLGLDNIESRIKSINGILKFDSGTFGISYEIDIPLNQTPHPA